MNQDVPVKYKSELIFIRHHFDSGTIRYILQKQTKAYKSELRHLFHCRILIPSKCPRKTLFQHTVNGPSQLQKGVYQAAPPT